MTLRPFLTLLPLVAFLSQACGEEAPSNSDLEPDGNADGEDSSSTGSGGGTQDDSTSDDDLIEQPDDDGAELPGYSLQWSDEFEEEGEPSADNWNVIEWEAGVVNMELQQYTDRSENVRVEGGVLVIEALRDNYEGTPYSSGRLTGEGKRDILYGRVDVRAKLPSGRGTWPAIWMMPSAPSSYGGWPNSGEIDIMEHVGYDMNVVHSSVHTEAFNWLNASQKTASTTVPDVAGEFHVYRLDWSADRLSTYIDDVPLFQFEDTGNGPPEWPFDKPFHVILNVAVGGNWGGTEGVDDSIFPQRMEVDYVRVYSAL